VTLIEFLVVLAVLGVMAGVVGLAWRPAKWTSSRSWEDRGNGIIAAARQRALESGRPVTVSVQDGERIVQVRALPDGRIIGAEAQGVDPLSGRRTTGVVP
jgi:prepilin-type N-terminal cleavage/methylation domain-containing protein